MGARLINAWTAAQQVWDSEKQHLTGMLRSSVEEAGTFLAFSVPHGGRS